MVSFFLHTPYPELLFPRELRLLKTAYLSCWRHILRRCYKLYIRCMSNCSFLDPTYSTTVFHQQWRTIALEEMNRFGVLVQDSKLPDMSGIQSHLYYVNQTHIHGISKRRVPLSKQSFVLCASGVNTGIDDVASPYSWSLSNVNTALNTRGLVYPSCMNKNKW